MSQLYRDYPRPERFPLAVKIYKPGSVTAGERRREKYSELVFILTGSAEHRIGAARKTVKQDDILLLHPGTVDAWYAESEFSMAEIIYDATVPLPMLEGSDLPFIELLYPQDYTAVDQLSPVMRMPFYDHDLCENLIRRLSYETHRKRLGRNVMIPLMFMELVIYFSRGESLREEEENLWLIQSPVEYLGNHCQEPLNLKHLCRLAGMSERTLFRHFRKHLGMSPNQYLNKIRVQKASELLKRNSLTIPQIALRCGFCDANHLTKMFVRIFGISPGAYRKDHQKRKTICPPETMNPIAPALSLSPPATSSKN